VAKVIDVPQGEAEWRALRLGLPTASRFDKVITNKTLKYSGQASKLIAQLIAERILEYSLEDWDGNNWSHRGTTMEAEARAYYSLQRDVDIEEIGFVTTDDGRAGASPDGKIVGVDAGIELKVFEASHHMRCLLGYEDPVKATQLQGQLWVCEWEYIDQLAYSPAFPPVILRTYRNEKFQKAMGECVKRFLGEMDEAQERLNAMGKQGRVETVAHVPLPDPEALE